MPCLCGRCGGSVALIFLVFIRLHRSGFILKFDLRPLSSPSEKWLLKGAKIEGRRNVKGLR